MGYEERVVIARRYGKKQENVMDILAELNLCGMPNGFRDLFTSEWKTGYYDSTSGMTVIKDKYDKTVTYTTFRKVHKWCIEKANLEHYRRLDLLLSVLDSIQRGWYYDLGDIIIIHYGY